MPNWVGRFLLLAEHVACWSKDPSTQVGCVIVDQDRRIVSVGYNGFPRGVDDSTERYADRPTKYAMVAHAELNAVLNASAPVKDCIAYVTHPPCSSCAGTLIQAGIKLVIAYEPEEGIAERFEESFKIAKTMFKEAGVGFYLMEKNDGQ